MIEYVNLLVLMTMFGSTCYVYYKLKKFFYLISIVMDYEILDQLTNLEKNVDSELIGIFKICPGSLFMLLTQILLVNLLPYEAD